MHTCNECHRRGCSCGSGSRAKGRGSRGRLAHSQSHGDFTRTSAISMPSSTAASASASTGKARGAMGAMDDSESGGVSSSSSSSSSRMTAVASMPALSFADSDCSPMSAGMVKPADDDDAMRMRLPLSASRRLRRKRSGSLDLTALDEESVGYHHDGGGSGGLVKSPIPLSKSMGDIQSLQIDTDADDYSGTGTGPGLSASGVGFATGFGARNSMVVGGIVTSPPTELDGFDGGADDGAFDLAIFPPTATAVTGAVTDAATATTITGAQKMYVGFEV